MDLQDIKHIGVIGAGVMGSGIAQVCATHGFGVTLIDVDQGALERALAGIARSLEKLAAKGRITPEQRAAGQNNIQTALELSATQDADLVIEAVTEKRDLKLTIFRELSTLTRPEVILASNTSSIPISALASATSRPENVIGMHFMNPVPLMELVEIISGLATSPQTTALVMELSRALGKTPVEAADYPGFIANRLLMPMINEAVFALMEGVGTAEAIDTVMRLGANHPMGPLALADLVGLDVVLDILNVLHEGLGDPKYRPCPLLKQMVSAGRLGRKSGEGFYSYD